MKETFRQSRTNLKNFIRTEDLEVVMKQMEIQIKMYHLELGIFLNYERLVTQDRHIKQATIPIFPIIEV